MCMLGYQGAAVRLRVRHRDHGGDPEPLEPGRLLRPTLYHINSDSNHYIILIVVVIVIINIELILIVIVAVIVLIIAPGPTLAAQRGRVPVLRQPGQR